MSFYAFLNEHHQTTEHDSSQIGQDFFYSLLNDLCTRNDLNSHSLFSREKKFISDCTTHGLPTSPKIESQFLNNLLVCTVLSDFDVQVVMLPLLLRHSLKIHRLLQCGFNIIAANFEQCSLGLCWKSTYQIMEGISNSNIDNIRIFLPILLKFGTLVTGTESIYLPILKLSAAFSQSKLTIHSNSGGITRTINRTQSRFFSLVFRIAAESQLRVNEVIVTSDVRLHETENSYLSFSNWVSSFTVRDWLHKLFKSRDRVSRMILVT
ncbi:hypothetical protein GEMRC1_005790 [Eukaryota sp. GEM-RC1]